MLCNEHYWILGTDNLFSRLGFSSCAISGIELMMVACVFAVFVLIFFQVATNLSRWVDWLYLKFSTRKASNSDT